MFKNSNIIHAFPRFDDLLDSSGLVRLIVSVISNGLANTVLKVLFLDVSGIVHVVWV